MNYKKYLTRISKLEAAELTFDKDGRVVEDGIFVLRSHSQAVLEVMGDALKEIQKELNERNK